MSPIELCMSPLSYRRLNREHRMILLNLLCIIVANMYDIRGCYNYTHVQLIPFLLFLITWANFNLLNYVMSL
jgi:hypothetical protein